MPWNFRSRDYSFNNLEELLMIGTPRNPRTQRCNPISRILTIAILISSTAFLFAQRPQPHWPAQAVVRVWIDRIGLPAGDDDLVERAMRTWTKASAGRLTLQRTLAENDANIRVYFNGAGGNYGETRPHVNAAGFLDAAEVAILADVPIEDVMTKRIIAYLTALHELGHAIGLDHTTNFTDIMYLFRYPDDGPRYFGNYRAKLKTADDIGGAAATGLSPSDIAALKALYDDKR